MVSRLIAEMMDQRIIARQGKHYILLSGKTAVIRGAQTRIAQTGKKMTESFANALRE